MDDSNEVVIDKILQICSELLTVSRDKHYKGQTPLHIAIRKGAFLVTKCLLSFSKSKSIKSITKKRATGRIFTNTVMMGELPLHVAALTFKESIVDLLLENGAKMHRQNGCGDTVFHSLVKYSAVYPNKADNVIKMFTYLNKKMRKQNQNHEPHQDQDTDIFLKRDLFVWSLENQDCLTPLQLSAKLGVVEIFQFIINLRNVYSFDSSHDGLFDVKLYDITEIDTVANHHIASITNADESDGKKKVSHNVVGISHKSVEANTDCNPVKCSQFNYPKTESILEMMFGYDYHSQAAFRIIETIPVKNIILEKWNKLKYIYFIWGFLHLVITVFITVELVIRSDLYALQSASNTTKLDIHIHESSRKFANIVSLISLILGGAVYSLMILLLLIAKARRPNALHYFFHNLGYLLFLIVFSVCLFIDFFMTRTKDTHNNIALIVAVIAGWWFSVFFLRAFLLFSFFTELIRRVIVGDLLRFAVIISFMLFAFTAGIYAAFVGEVGSEQNTSKYQEAVTEHFDSFGGAMLRFDV
ncbi:unnamed protein product [Mytilus edulis]|uniref:Uncharacterized protein n=1 Tax=Mytilus edulis TaxID=6550 RepID=A0A8S3Q730_MYTED|nr:unnamed protein product [Mytilus edulis]